MKNVIMMLLVFVFGWTTLAQEKKDKNAKHAISVAGNCEMCKKRIEKAAYSVPGVKSAVWDVDKQQLQLIVNEEKSSVNQIEKAVAKVGHDTKNVKATDEAYADLHTCCAYERK